jgi:uncharacterized protein
MFKMFTSKEADNLDYVLTKVADLENALYLEELHGLLFGLAIIPEPIAPSEWLPIIFGGGGPCFDDEEDAQECIGYLMAAYNRIMKDADLGKLRFPFECDEISVDRFEIVEGWVYGLFLSLSLRPDYWGLSEEYEKMADEDISEEMKNVIDAACIITAIALPEECKVSENPAQGEAAKSREEIFAAFYEMLPLCVETLQDHGEMLRRKMFSGKKRSGGRDGTKVGRNAPCPCGSGKKYKKCCGAN